MLFGIILALAALIIAVWLLFWLGREAVIYIAMMGMLSCVAFGYMFGWPAAVAAVIVLAGLALFKWWRPIPTK